MRKLAAAALSFSAAVFAANYILPLSWLIAAALILSAAALVLLTFRRKWLLGFEIGLFAAALGLAVFFIHAQFTAVPAKSLDSQELLIEAKLLDYPRVYEDYCSVEVKLTGENTPRLKALLYDNDMALKDALPGQYISLNAKLKSADIRYGEDYDNYYSKGIYFTLSSRGDIEIRGEGGDISTLPVRIRQAVIATVDSIFPADTAHFMRSVMLGDKSGLYEDTALYLSLSRAGFMHLAAVSGMHLAYLAVFLRLLLGSSRSSSLITIILLWLFVLVTGASPSAVRAGFMQTALLMAPIFRREDDPVTSLSAVLALVLLKNPYAACSISLQLSFAAMAGIMCFTDRISLALEHIAGDGALAERLRKPIGVVAASLSVMVFTMPIMALHFGYISVLSPISNVLALWAAPFIFCGGFICCAVGSVVPMLGTAAAWLLSWLARYFFLVSKLISDIDFAVVYLDNIFMWLWFGLSLACILSAIFVRLPLTVRLIYPIIMTALILAEANSLSRWYYASGNGTMAVLDVGQGQSIAGIYGDAAVVIDCGGKGSLDRAGDVTGAYLVSRGVNEIDALVLTHLHSDHANGVLTLMEMLDIENIYMPADPLDEEGLLQPILQSAEEHGTKVHYVWGDWEQRFGNIRLMLYKPATRGDANERCVMCRMSFDDFDMLITADAPTAAENELTERVDLPGTEVLIAGHHGSRYSTGQALLEELEAKIAVISCGYNNYGHPTYETLARLEAYGLEIYRTDLNSTVEIRP